MDVSINAGYEPLALGHPGAPPRGRRPGRTVAGLPRSPGVGAAGGAAGGATGAITAPSDII